MTKASDNLYPSVLLVEQGSAPSSPSAGDQRLFIDSADHLLKLKNSGGTVTAIGGASVVPNLILDYTLGSDISALATTGGAWTDIIANQNFTVANASSLVEIAVRGLCFINGGTGQLVEAIRVVIDSAGTPIYEIVGGSTTETAARRGNPLAGAPIFRSGLSAATHTIKLQVFQNGDNTPTFYCRPSGSPPESIRIQIVEHLPA